MVFWTNAHTVSSKEALNLLSLLRMGVDLELFPAGNRSVVDEMFILSQPAHVQKAAERKLTAEERDSFRADLISPAAEGCFRNQKLPKPACPKKDQSWHERGLRWKCKTLQPRAQQVLALARKEADRF